MDSETIIQKALSYVGVTGTPQGSHNVPFNTDYYGYQVNDKNAYYWCVVFVWDVFRLAGAPELFCDGDKANHCSKVESWAKSNGLTVPKDQIRRGDLVLFDWQPNNSPDHIGFALSSPDGGYFQTVEGNVSDSVKQMTRSLSQVHLAIRPRYTNASSSGCNPETCPILAYLANLIGKE